MKFAQKIPMKFKIKNLKKEIKFNENQQEIEKNISVKQVVEKIF